MTYDNYLYNKLVKLTFDEFKHSYYFEGKKIPSVTTILSIINKPALIAWAANMAADSFKEAMKAGVAYDELQINEIYTNAKAAHRKKKTDAGDVGTFIHKYIEDYIKGKNPPPPVNDQLRESTEQFLKWQKDHEVKFLSSEQVVYSKQHQYCGTLDFICRYEDKLILGDAKTSNSGPYPEWWLQTAAYRHAREEEFPKEKYQGQAIIRIGKDGSFSFDEKNNYEQDFAGFLFAKGLYETIKEMEDRAKNA